MIRGYSFLKRFDKKVLLSLQLILRSMIQKYALCCLLFIAISCKSGQKEQKIKTAVGDKYVDLWQHPLKRHLPKFMCFAIFILILSDVVLFPIKG